MNTENTDRIAEIRERLSAYDSGHPAGKRMLERNAQPDIVFLLAEVDRVTRERDKWKERAERTRPTLLSELEAQIDGRTAERDAARAEVEKLRADKATLSEERRAEWIRAENAESEVDRLKSDAARLDWLEKEKPRQVYHYANGFTAVDSKSRCHDGATIRAAIDAARK